MPVEITSDMIKKLRERTGVGMSKCKQALDSAGGDMEQAIDILRKEGAASAVKKSTRETNEGIIGAKENAKAVALVEVNAETDFVTKNDKFISFVEGLVEDALAHSPVSLEKFLTQTAKNGRTHEDMRVEMVQSIGENIQIRRVQVWQKQPNASYGLYVHLGGKITTLVEISGSASMGALAKDVAMHIAADAPEYLKPDEIPAEALAREKDIAMSQLQGKPAAMMDKIIAGKLKAYADQVCLLGQKYVKDNSVTVEQHVTAEGKKAGAALVVTKFLRWEVGGA